MFIHDALSDYITCGDTSVLAYELHTASHTMQKVDDKGRSGFMKQFEVHKYIPFSHGHATM